MFVEGGNYIAYIGVIILMSVNPDSPYKEVYKEYLKPLPTIEDCKTATIEKSELLIIKSFNNGSPVIRKLACHAKRMGR